MPRKNARPQARKRLIRIQIRAAEREAEELDFWFPRLPHRRNESGDLDVVLLRAAMLAAPMVEEDAREAGLMQEATRAENDARCAAAMPDLWPEVLRIREAATAAGLDCSPGIGGDTDLGDAKEMCLGIYRGGKIIGCASREEGEDTWSWFIKGGSSCDAGYEAALVAAFSAYEEAQ